MLVKQGINIQFVHNLPMQKISSLWFAADIAILFLFYIICSHISMEKKINFQYILKEERETFCFYYFSQRGSQILLGGGGEGCSRTFVLRWVLSCALRPLNFSSLQRLWSQVAIPPPSSLNFLYFLSFIQLTSSTIFLIGQINGILG